MDEHGLWELFCKTGLPEAYLVMAQSRRENEICREEPVKTAFQPRIGEV